MSAFSVMSFNLRYPALDRHPVAARLPVAAALIERAHPHLIGTQEGEIDQLESLIELLPEEYRWLGEGFAGGNAGEFTAVIYDSSRFEPETVDVSWLSEAPETVNSESWGVSHARTLTTVDFTDLRDARSLRLLNTHLDHKSERARLNSARIIGDHLGEGPALLTGDFNVATGAPVYDFLCGDLRLADTAVEAPGEDIGTFHRYRGPRRGEPRIDWILTSAGLRTLSTRINTYAAADGTYPSDHFPIEAVVDYV